MGSSRRAHNLRTMKRDQSHRMTRTLSVLVFVFASATGFNHSSTKPDDNWSQKQPIVSTKQENNRQYQHHPQQLAFADQIKKNSDATLRSKLIYSPEQLQGDHQQTVGVTLTFKHPQFTGIEKVIRNTGKSSDLFEEKQSFEPQPLLQHSESGIVYHVHPEALKNGQIYQTPQSFKQIQADGTTLNFVPHQQYPNLAQPQYLLQQQAQNNLLNKQPSLFYSQPIQTPTTLPYHTLNKLPQLSNLNQFTPTPQVLNYQSNPHTALPPQYSQYIASPKLPASQKLVGGYPLQQSSYIDKGKASAGGLANYKGVSGGVPLPHGLTGQIQSPQHGSAPIFSQTQQNQAVNFLGDDNQGGGPDFSKMFQSYFNSGPFAQSFQDDGDKPAGTSVIPNVNSEFNNFFGELNQAAPSSALKKEPSPTEDQFKPCNFFQASNAKIQDDDSEEYRRPNKGSQRPYRGPYRESSEEDDDDDEDSDDDSSEENSSEQRYKNPQRHEEKLNRYRNDDNVDYSAPQRKPNTGKNEGAGQTGDRHSGKSSSQRKVNSNRPRYQSREEDDDEDDESDKKFRTERDREQFENNYNEAKSRYVVAPSKDESSNQRAQKEATNPNAASFYQYKYPPPPSYDSEGRTRGQNQSQSRPEHRGALKNEKRPPPVHEPDAVGYYSNISPKVTRDYVYSSQKVVVSGNHPELTLKSEMMKGA